MKIILDVMGGDNAPLPLVKGAILALEEKDIEIVLVGKEDKIKTELKKYKYDSSRITIKNATEIIKMTDDPIEMVKKKKDSSIVVAINMLKSGEGDALVSASNTGALLTASQLILRRIKGVLRPAIASVFPKEKGQMLILDLGATSDSKPEFIEQYALMGSKYLEIMYNLENPKVGLLNIGSEEKKGNILTRDAYNLLENNERINFKGNIEPTTMISSDIDVVVTDGFTGNIMLKTSEGIAKYISNELKKLIMQNFFYKICGLFLKPVFKTLRKKTDSSEYGGAIFLGLNGICIKIHGNSNENSVKNGIKRANKFAKMNFIGELKNTLEVSGEKCRNKGIS